MLPLGCVSLIPLSKGRGRRISEFENSLVYSSSSSTVRITRINLIPNRQDWGGMPFIYIKSFQTFISIEIQRFEPDRIRIEHRFAHSEAKGKIVVNMVR